MPVTGSVWMDLSLLFFILSSTTASVWVVEKVKRWSLIGN